MTQVQEEGKFEEDMLTEMLPVYYKRLFPFGPFYRWLSYGNIDSRHFSNREFSFTLHDDIYIRYQTFNNQSDLEEAVKKKSPYKIDIGAVFSLPPSSHRQVNSSLVPIERELVFDIDLTDYDEVRTCCQGADVCTKCWKFMSLACKIIDSALREDFGFQHLLWVFSGRRGVHCWVCDASARQLTGPERSAVAEYLQLITGGDEVSKKVNLPNTEKLHSSIRRAVDIVEEYFVNVCIEEQGLLDDPNSIKKLLSLVPDENLKARALAAIENSSTSKEKWIALTRELRSKNDDNRRRRHWLVEEIMLQYAYPRLDINVTKGLNHLLKSPFCIHPKTGKVCVPINPKAADKFNPTTVPTLDKLIDEVNKYDADLKKQLSEDDTKSRVKDYKKTSMNKSIQVFEEFVRNLEDTWKGQNIKIAKSDLSMEF